MIHKNDLARIQTLIEQNIGKRVKIMVKKGRKRIVIRYGTINAVYPFTFNVTLDGISEFSETKRNVSLNYADVLTRTLSLFLIDTEEEIR